MMMDTGFASNDPVLTALENIRNGSGLDKDVFEEEEEEGGSM
jgi:hypothetical protein